MARTAYAQNQAMGQPEERRHADHLVEPLLAGLRDADPLQGAEAQADATARPDPWTHPPRPAELELRGADLEDEPSSVRLFLKALLVMLALIAGGAVVYFVFGP